MSVPRHVVVLLTLGLIVIGVSPLLIRFAGETPALAIAAWRTMFVAAMMLPVAWTTKREEIQQLTRREWGLVGAAGVFLSGHFMMWIGSVQLTSVASASVLVAMAPVFIAILGALFLNERPTRKTTLAILAAVLGAVLIGAGEASPRETPLPNPMLGNGLALTAALLVSVYLLIGRSVRQRLSFVTYFALLSTAAALTTLTACLVLGVELVHPWPMLGLFLLMALGPGLLGHGSFNLALAYVSAAFLGLLSLAEPVIATLGAFLLFKEVPSALTFLGAVIVLVAIATVVRGDRA
ncbi:MAG: DMT family transporter [Rubricoccaceae bacterium]